MPKTLRAAVTVALAAGALAACQVTAPPPVSDPPAATVAGVREPDEQFCGGFGGLPCPDHYVCIDDPSDDCDPQRGGGADCAGICVAAGDRCSLPGRYYASHDPAVCAATMIRCPPGFDLFFDQCGCGCERSSPAGELCGEEAVCQANEYCCNPSCGICAPLGGVCVLTECE